MKKKSTRIYMAVFTVLTVMTWSPLGYGSYGTASRIFGMPEWAVTALLAGVVLFALEWFFLFFSGRALDDKDVDELIWILKSTQEETGNEPVVRRKVTQS